MNQNPSGILTGRQIREMSLGEGGLIWPFSEKVKIHKGNPVPSGGVSGAGYDLTLSPHFKRLRGGIVVIDPMDVGADDYEDFSVKGEDRVILRPGQHLLGVTVEKMTIPNDVIGFCTGKSTYVRLGVYCYVTPMEPGWSGYLTVEMVNHGSRPVFVPLSPAGFLQAVFHRLSEPVESYGSISGRYCNDTMLPSGPRASREV